MNRNVGANKYCRLRWTCSAYLMNLIWRKELAAKGSEGPNRDHSAKTFFLTNPNSSSSSFGPSRQKQQAIGWQQLNSRDRLTCHQSSGANYYHRSCITACSLDPLGLRDLPVLPVVSSPLISSGPSGEAIKADTFSGRPKATLQLPSSSSDILRYFWTRTSGGGKKV